MRSDRRRRRNLAMCETTTGADCGRARPSTRPPPTPAGGSGRPRGAPAFHLAGRASGGRVGSAGTRIRRGKRGWPARVAPVFEFGPHAGTPVLDGLGVMFAMSALRFLRCDIALFQPRRHVSPIKLDVPLAEYEFGDPSGRPEIGMIPE